MEAASFNNDSCLLCFKCCDALNTVNNIMWVNFINIFCCFANNYLPQPLFFQ
jgi:hypothetical protein